MHYLIGATFESKPSEADVEIALEPFSENLAWPLKYSISLDIAEVESRLTQGGGDNLQSLLKRESEYDQIKWSPEEGFYQEVTGNPQGYWDWWEIGGRWDNMLNLDDSLPIMEKNTCRLSDWKEKGIEPAGLIVDGVWFGSGANSHLVERDRMGRWNFAEIEKDEMEEVRKLIQDNLDLWVVGVDCHR